MKQAGCRCAFAGSGAWVVLSEIEQSIKRKIEAVGKPLRDWDVSINYGIKTGFNDAFIVTTQKRDEILASCRTEEERTKTSNIFRPILRGRDIKRYGYDWANLWLINTHNGVKGKIPRIDINDYPAIKAHLDQYWDKIKDRADQGDTPYNLRNCAYLEDFGKPKIVWGNLSLSANYAFLEKDFFINAPSTMIVPGDKFLLAVLNSTLADFYIRKLGVTRNGGYFEYKPMFVELLPIPEPCVEVKDTIISLVDNEMYEQIDKRICELYGLTVEEIDYLHNM